MNDPSYADLERRAALDLATRTIVDPKATPEHVAEATRRLRSGTPNAPDLAEITRGMTPTQVNAWRVLLRAYGDGAEYPGWTHGRARYFACEAVAACMTDRELRAELIAELRGLDDDDEASVEPVAGDPAR